MQWCRYGRLGQVHLYLLHRDLREESCSIWLPFFQVFLVTFCHHPWCHVEKKLNRKNQDPRQIYSASQSWASLKAMLFWKDSSVWQGEQHVPVFCLCPAHPGWGQPAIQHKIHGTIPPRPALSLHLSNTSLKKQQEKWANLHLKAALYPWLTDREDKPQGYSLHKPNETERRDGKGQCSGTCNTHAS